MIRLTHGQTAMVLLSSLTFPAADARAAQRAQPTGDLQVTVRTTGDAPDPDGYAIEIAGASHPIEARTLATVKLSGLPAGGQTITLTGIAEHCTVSGGASRRVTIQARVPLAIEFPVACETPAQEPKTDPALTADANVAGELPPTDETPPPTDPAGAEGAGDTATPEPDGVIEVTTFTSGPAPDLSYSVRIDGVDKGSIGANQSQQFQLTAGEHEVGLTVPNDCVVARNLQRVFVQTGAMAGVSFGIECKSAARTEPTVVKIEARPAAQGAAKADRDDERALYQRLGGADAVETLVQRLQEKFSGHRLLAHHYHATGVALPGRPVDFEHLACFASQSPRCRLKILSLSLGAEKEPSDDCPANSLMVVTTGAKDTSFSPVYLSGSAGVEVVDGLKTTSVASWNDATTEELEGFLGVQFRDRRVNRDEFDTVLILLTETLQERARSLSRGGPAPAEVLTAHDDLVSAVSDLRDAIVVRR